MPRGKDYQPLFTPTLGYVQGRDALSHIIVPMLCWAGVRLYQTNVLPREIEIWVVEIYFHGGPYPGIGLSYSDKKPSVNWGEAADDAIEKMIAEKGIQDFLLFLKKSDCDWNQVSEGVVKHGRYVRITDRMVQEEAASVWPIRTDA